jgi:hypothetical protein
VDTKPGRGARIFLSFPQRTAGDGPDARVSARWQQQRLSDDG